MVRPARVAVRAVRSGPYPEQKEQTRTLTIVHAEEELIQRFINELDSQRRVLLDALRLSWLDVEEALFVPSNSVLTLKAQSDNEERIDFIMAYAGVAAGKGGLIELGDADRPHTIPVPAGVFLATSVKIRLKNTSTRRLSVTTFTNNAPTFPADQSASGFLYLGLFGAEVPIGAIRA